MNDAGTEFCKRRGLVRHYRASKECIVYELWSRQLIETFQGKFVTRALGPYDWDIHSMVEKQDHPVPIPTGRHIRQMAFDIQDVGYDGQQRTLHGVSRAVAGENGGQRSRVKMSNGKSSIDESPAAWAATMEASWKSIIGRRDL